MIAASMICLCSSGHGLHGDHREVPQWKPRIGHTCARQLQNTEVPKLQYECRRFQNSQGVHLRLHSTTFYATGGWERASEFDGATPGGRMPSSREEQHGGRLATEGGVGLASECGQYSRGLHPRNAVRLGLSFFEFHELSMHVNLEPKRDRETG